MASLEYLAGYFDGEGCVCISDNTNIGKTMALIVSVQTGDPEILQLFAEEFGGTVKKAKPVKNTRRQLYYWKAYGTNAQKALRQLIPFLKGKREVAELALIPAFDFKGRNSVPLTELQHREGVATKIKAINNRVTVAAA